MTCKITLNMIYSSYHLVCRLWKVLSSPFFKRGKLDSETLPGSPTVAQLMQTELHWNPGQHGIQARAPYNRNRNFICVLKEIIFLWETFIPPICISQQLSWTCRLSFSQIRSSLLSCILSFLLFPAKCPSSTQQEVIWKERLAGEESVIKQTSNSRQYPWAVPPGLTF